MTMEDKIKETALEEVEKIRGLTVEAVKSRAYLYPLKASMPSYQFDAQQLIIWSGNLLLLVSSKSVEALLVESDADHHYRRFGHYFHVPFHISSPSCSACSGQWTSGCRICYSSSLKREFRGDKLAGKELLHRGCINRYIRCGKR